jgi:hypothetical protein
MLFAKHYAINHQGMKVELHSLYTLAIDKQVINFTLAASQHQFSLD